MPKIRKATLGIRTVEKMFRLSSLTGLIADAVVSIRDKAPLDETYFTEVGRVGNDTSVRLSNESRGNYLIVDLENVVFTHDVYDDERDFDFESFFNAFGVIWDAVNSILRVRDVRRIGFVAEYRFPAKGGVSNELLSSITKLKPKGFTEKFQLQYETRRGTGVGGLPDPRKDDFYNYIHAIYDSIGDLDHPQAGHFNANLDVQRYYAPPLTKDVLSEARSLRREFEKAVGPFFEDIEKLGLSHAKAA